MLYVYFALSPTFSGGQITANIFTKLEAFIMKKIFVLFAFVCLSSAAFAQVTIDTFETYDNTTSMTAVWDEVIGFSTRSLGQGAGLGADSTDQWIEVTDAGYSNGIIANGIITPPVSSLGGYKLTFSYKNGHTATVGENPWSALQVKIDQGASNVITVDLPGDVKTTWTAAESLGVILGTDPIKITITGTAAAVSGETNVAAFDEFKLVEINPPVTVALRPTEVVYLSGTDTITATPGGGSGTYTKVDFDVDANGSIEFTDNTAPYEFAWDTTTSISGASGTVDLKAIATDDGAQTGELVLSYFIDNRASGRQQLVANGDFEGTWAANVPQDWTLYQTGASPTYGQGTGYDGSGSSLEITFGATDYTNRYVFRSTSWDGAVEDIQTTGWGKGTSARLFYFFSDDGGTTWNHVNISDPAVNFGDSNWIYKEEQTVRNSSAYTSSDLVAICTHMFNAETCNWDNVSVKGIDLRPADVNDWNLY